MNATWAETDRSRRTFETAGAVLLLLAGLYAFPLRSFVGFTAVPGDLGDARFNSFILEHVYRWLIGEEPSLWSPRIFYPFANTLAFSDAHLGTAPVYAVFRILGLARETAFDAWFLVGNAASYLGCWWALRRLGLGPLAAGAGAFVFAFGSPMLAQIGHAQLVYRFAIPLALQALWEAFETRRALPLWRVALWTAVQFLGSIYLGVFLVYLLAGGTVAVLLTQGLRPAVAMVASLRAETLPRLGLLIGGVLLSLAAVGLLLMPYLRASVDYGFGPRLGDIATMLPRPASYLLADGNVLLGPLSRRLGSVPMRHEHQMFFGVVAWVAMLGGLATTVAVPRWRSLGLFALLTLAVLGVATLSVGGHSFNLAVAEFPGIGAIRAVSRIVLAMLLPAGILAAIGVQGLQDWLWSRAWPAAALAAVGILLLLPAEALLQPIQAEPNSAWRARVAALRARLPDPLPRDAILFVTSASGDRILSELDAMLLAQDLGIATLNGYSSSDPPGSQVPLTCLAVEQRLAGYALFRHLSAEAVAALAARTVTVERPPCTSQARRVVRTRSIGPDIAARMSLGVTDVRRAGDRITATVVVTNRSGERLDPLSVLGESLKLSWRFVPTGAAASLAEGWDTRFDLVESIEPGKAHRYELIAEAPGRGSFLLQVSMVEEGVMWLHDHGLAIASAPVPAAPP